ncbi:MAG: hypothetical protein Q4G28_12865, partial [Neisseria sp.]|nr:hypothetical protein [Neisseria sp.]
YNSKFVSFTAEAAKNRTIRPQPYTVNTQNPNNAGKKYTILFYNGILLQPILTAALPKQRQMQP